MKARILTIIMLTVSTLATAQTFVGTEPQKRPILIEEFTGVNCQYCPLGHRTIDQLMAMFPGRVLGINIHQGMYASRYTTQFGTALATQAGVQGYPTGTMNRHMFANAGMGLNPGEFYMRSLQLFEMDATVNVAAMVDFNEDTRVMTVTVEGYYTADAAESSNLLNVALLQSNVLSSQVGASTWYPENMVGSQYRHNHMLRHLLTGQWGDTIAQTTAGSFFSKTYTMTLPEAIGDVPIASFDDLSVVVFVCENHREVIGAAEAIRTGDRPRLLYGDAEQDECTLDFHPYVTVVNPTGQTVSQVTLDVDGTTLTLNRPLGRYCTDTVHLPDYSITDRPATHQSYGRDAYVRLTGYTAGGTAVAVDNVDLFFRYGDVNIITAEGPLVFAIHYDQFPTEVSFSLDDMATCSTFYAGGGQASQINRNASYRLSPAAPGLYRFSISDVGGDGLDGSFGFYDAAGNVILGLRGDNLMHREWYLNITNAGDGTAEEMSSPVAPPSTTDGIAAAESVRVALWPNPVRDRLSVSVDGTVLRADVVDLTGRVVATAPGNEVDVQRLPAGFYLLRLVSDRGVAVARFVKE